MELAIKELGFRMLDLDDLRLRIRFRICSLGCSAELMAGSA